MSQIAALRRETGLSQAKFAELFNIPKRTLQQWEQGRSAPPPYVEGMMRKILSLGTKAKPHVHSIPSRSTWKVCIDRPFENCERIYPIQQRKVRAILDRVENNPAVKRVVVFGSSVTQACHAGSDVDIYFDLAEDASIPLSDLGFEVDSWSNYTVDDRLKREIEQKGVVVYEQSGDALR